MLLKKPILIAILSLLLSNCSQTKTIYDWSDYESTIYEYNKNDLSIAEFERKLSAIIVNSENKGRVPPGLYAEYGYILLELRRFDEAGKYFKKESETWPESRQLMNLMIKRVDLQKKQKLGK